MKIQNLNDYVRGWVVGKFSPALLEANIEVGIMKHHKGEICPAHYHKEADEINIVISGFGIFSFISGENTNDVNVSPNDIITVHQNEVVQFRALDDVVMVVIKTKSAKGDKYIV